MGRIQKCLLLTATLFAGVLFVFLFSVGSSPLYKGDSIVFDTTVFQSVGWLWSKGYAPYVFSWDHKGPLIYGINALCYLLGDGNGNHTLWHMLLEGIAVGLFFFYVYRTLRTHFEVKMSAFYLLLTIIVLAGTYAGGANIENFTLPFCGVCLYVTLEWLNKFERGEYRFNPWYGFFNGIFLAFALLTRLTDAAGACGIMAAVCILLAWKGEWKNGLVSAAMFVFGFLVLCLPFFLYFYLIGGLDEMIFGTITFNYLYASELADLSLAKVFSHVLSSFPVYALLAFSVSLFCLGKEERPRAFVWFMATVLMCAWWLPSRRFLKYAILAVPYLPILIIELDRQKKRFPRMICQVVIALCCLIPMENLRFIHSFKNNDIVPLTERLEDEIPVEDRTSFMAYGITPQIYMNLDAVPCYRFHFGQEYYCSLSDEIRQEVHDLFASKKAKWICAQGDTSEINDILESSYLLVDDCSDIGPYKVYRLVE